MQHLRTSLPKAPPPALGCDRFSTWFCPNTIQCDIVNTVFVYVQGDPGSSSHLDTGRLTLLFWVVARIKWDDSTYVAICCMAHVTS